MAAVAGFSTGFSFIGDHSTVRAKLGVRGAIPSHRAAAQLSGEG